MNLEQERSHWLVRASGWIVNTTSTNVIQHKPHLLPTIKEQYFQQELRQLVPRIEEQYFK